MKREIDLNVISDGKLYTANDMVKADCGDCKGCSACCRGMGQSIVLDPLDVFRLIKKLNQNFEELIGSCLELRVVDGLILPNLKMQGEEEQCAFLSEEGRCSIHAERPGFCRLFPLGRYYENGSFRYFLQIHECKKENRAKIKVKKWLDVPDVKCYEKFINDWHYYLVSMQDCLSEKPDKAKKVSMYILKQFYLLPYNMEEDFYSQFYHRLEEAKNCC